MKPVLVFYLDDIVFLGIAAFMLLPCAAVAIANVVADAVRRVYRKLMKKERRIANDS